MNEPVVTGQRRILLDANVLLLLLVGTADPSLIGEFKRTAAFTEDDFDLLQLVLTYFNDIVTTPHVLTEVSNLLGQLPEHLHETAFAHLRGAIETLNENTTAAQLITSEAIFTRLGLTDAAVTYLARTRVIEVLTVDSALWVHLNYQGVTAYNFHHIRDHGMFD